MINNYIIFNFFQEKDSESKLVKLKDIDFIKKKILTENQQRKRIKLQLLYRATRDGFSGSSFHSKCDGKSPTLSIIQNASNNMIFGGFTSMSWDQSSGYKTNDPTAFIFSVNNAKTYKCTN